VPPRIAPSTPTAPTTPPSADDEESEPDALDHETATQR